MKTCVIVLAVYSAAQAHKVPPAALLSIALYESRLKPNAIGDDGQSFGAFQIYLRYHRLRCLSLPCQADYAARLLSRFVRRSLRSGRSNVLPRAIQRWNYNRRGYAQRVLRWRSRARKLIKSCRVTK